jgi:hypothetical protein
LLCLVVSKSAEGAIMSDLVRTAHASAEPSDEAGNSGKRVETRQALELVAVRGRDVLGVRRLVEGGTAWVGNVTDALARISLDELGGQPLLVGEVLSGEHMLYVPARARARTHKRGDLPRLLAGPHRIALCEGERAVLVLGAVQIRAQIVRVAVSPTRAALTGAAGWIALAAAGYVMALGICAALAPPPSLTLDRGVLQRLHAPYLHFLDTAP